MNEPSDVYEQEADRIADQVMTMPAHLAVGNSPPRIQRLAGQPTGQMDAAPASIDRALASSGAPLEPMLRRDMERRFGQDFSQVRVHSGAVAEQSARDVNANAYTVGRDIVFGAGRFTPWTQQGRQLLAHELTHVVQQGGGRSPAAALPLQAQRADLLQRQEGESVEEDDIDLGEVIPSTTLSTPPPEFGPQTVEQGCPPVPTGLGNLRPDPPCPTSEEEIPGRHFQFCLDSDVFRDQEQLGNLRSFARSQRADSIFKVHGFASTVGAADYNLILSCHRAKRAARELQNAGVPSQQIQIAAKGETRDFGPDPADNQTVLVGAQAPQGQTTPGGPVPTSPRAVVDRAVARILARDYRLAADAYLSRWTCGMIPNAAEMVRRITIKIQGEPPDDLQPTRMGLATSRGLREIWLGRDMFSDASDPVLCAMARILDLGFHQFVHDKLGVAVNDRGTLHQAAIFFVELAGIPPCETPGTPNPLDPTRMVHPARPWWSRLTTDPLASISTDCPDRPLPGPIDPQHQPRRPATPLTFTVSEFRPESSAAPIEPQIDESNNMVRVASPRGAFHLNATVQAAGDASQFNRYQVGFLQTVVEDETVVEFVRGDAVHLAVPTPLRDGPPRRFAPPPWFMPRSVATLDASGAATTELSDSPSASMPLTFIDFSRRGRVARPADMVQEGNDLNRAQVRTTFHTWVAARRDDAPLDRFSTHFIEGREVRFSLNLDMIGHRGTANFESQIDATPLTDSTPMQLAGPTPADINPSLRLTHVSPSTPRAQVTSAADLAEIRRRVRAVADDLAPLRQALQLDGPIMVRVRFDRTSGRMILDTPARRATTVEETGPAEDRVGVSETGREQLAREFTIRLRKDLVAAPSVPDLSEGIPTAFRSLPSFNERRRRQGSPDPFAAEHGIGLIGRIREQAELNRSAEQLRTQPDVYDPTFWPDIRVELAQENYCFNFTISGVNIDEVCDDPTLRTAGCVRWFPPERFSLRSDPTFVVQQLAGETFNSPVALRLTTFPILFVMFTPRENPGGDTFNHEMHHMIDCFNLTQSLKERMARRIRARLMEIRRLAAENPQLKDTLLSRQTILEIVRQENQPFVDFFGSEFQTRGRALHAREGRSGLPPYRSELPASWTTFHEPTLRGGTTGSFDDKPCR